MRCRSIVAILLFAVGISAGCGNGAAGRAGDATVPSNITLDEVYARMERALDGGAGKVFHASVTEEIKYSFSGPTPQGADAITQLSYTDGLWVDASTGVARVDTNVTDPASHAGVVSRLIARKDGTFRVDTSTSDEVDSLTCRGTSSILLARLMLCSNYLEKSSASVESGEYDGRPAIVLHTNGTLPSEDASPPFEQRLYVDPGTYLPVGGDESISMSPGAPAAAHTTMRYSIEFVDRSTLATNFFEPAAIGYVEKNPAANLTPKVDGMRVYWLGSEFDGAAGVPTLLLNNAHVITPGPSIDYRVTAAYELSGGRRNYPVINLQEYPTDAWAKLGWDSSSGDLNRPDAHRVDVTLPDRRAVIFQVPGSPDRYVAYVYFDTTVVFVLDGGLASPYSNHDAMLAVVKGLRPFEQP